jgi:predicted Zn-dependent peptidase
VNVQTHTLSNGFRIVTETMEGLGSAAIGIWVNVGGRHEVLAQNGIAHFLEHMAFKGTARRSALRIAEEIEDVGGYINAYTSREMTAYYARVLGADVPMALDVLADILRNSTFDPKEIEVERGVILQEIGQAYDTPDDIIFDWLQEAAYPGQPIGRTILGPEDRVSSFTRDDLVAFTSQHYGPGNMILSAAGAVDHDALVAQAEALFGDMPAAPPSPYTPASFQGGERREVKSLEQVHYALAFQIPSYRDQSIYTAQIFSSAFGGGMSSRLFQEVRERRGLCYTIFAQAGAYDDTGLLTIYAGTSGTQTDDLSAITIDQLKRAADDMSDQEIARASAQMKAGMVMGLESPSSRAERMARMIAIWNRVPDLTEVVENIDAVTTQNVRDFAAGLLDDRQAALAVYGPVQDTPMTYLDGIKARMAA